MRYLRILVLVYMDQTQNDITIDQKKSFFHQEIGSISVLVKSYKNENNKKIPQEYVYFLGEMSWISMTYVQRKIKRK